MASDKSKREKKVLLSTAQQGIRSEEKILRPCHTKENMQKLMSLLFTTLISISIIALAPEGMAQKSAAP